MVYSAAGVPLYVPKKYAKPSATSSDAVSARLLQAEDGMQSLLSAIELDMNHGRHSSDHSTDLSLQSSAIDSPDHQDLMADLLGTNFTDTIDMRIEENVTNVHDDQFPSSKISASDEINFLNSLGLSDMYGENGNLGSELAGSVCRIWSGVPEQWKDKLVREARIRQVIKHHLAAIMDADMPITDPHTSLTRVRLAWPTVAQKSYGHERRLLVPFPTCTVYGASKHIFGESPRLNLSICPNASGSQSSVETAVFGADMQAHFRSLSINNDTVGRSKSVKLKFQIAQRESSDFSDSPLLELTTSDVLLLSKPSKSSNRLKLQSSFIFTNTSLSLFSRMNSQTARTRHLSIADGHLRALPFSNQPLIIQEFVNGEVIDSKTAQPLMYDTVIVLKDAVSGSISMPLVVRKVEGKALITGSCTNVSQMHKIVLEHYSCRNAEVVNQLDRTFLSSTEAHRSGDSRNYKDAQSFSAAFEPALYRASQNGLEMSDAAQWTIVGLSTYGANFLHTLTTDAVLGNHDSHKNDQKMLFPSRKRKLDSDETIDHGPARLLRPGSIERDSGCETDMRDKSGNGAASLGVQFRPCSVPSIQTPLTPLPSLASPPSYLDRSRILCISVKDYWQVSSCLANMDIYLGHFGPLSIIQISQSTSVFTDATLKVELPLRSEVEGHQHLPLLFVREDGIVVLANCNIHIPA